MATEKDVDDAVNIFIKHYKKKDLHGKELSSPEFKAIREFEKVFIDKTVLFEIGIMLSLDHETKDIDQLIYGVIKRLYEKHKTEQLVYLCMFYYGLEKAKFFK